MTELLFRAAFVLLTTSTGLAGAARLARWWEDHG